MSLGWFIVAFIFGGVMTYLQVAQKYKANYYESLSIPQLSFEVIAILNTIVEQHDRFSNYSDTSYCNDETFKTQVTELKNRIREKDYAAIYVVYNHFLPNASFEKLSQHNNWHSDYKKLKTRFDLIYASLVKKL